MKYVPVVCGALALTAALTARGASFDRAEFEAAQAAGKPVLVAVHASWCPVDARQKSIVDALLSRARMSEYRAFVVAFDGQKDALKRLGVQTHGTLIVYRGGREVARSSGETDAHKIAALLESAL
jgi:thioredoxin 1